MILLPFGIGLVFIGLWMLGNQCRSLANLQKGTATLLGYERESNGLYYAVLTFLYKTDRYFFRNATPFTFPRYPLSSEHTIYIDPAKSAEIMGSPMKCTLAYFEKGKLKPWIFIGAGIFTIALFSQISGVYFILALSLVTLFFLYNRVQNWSFRADVESFPLSETFTEEKLKERKLLDLPALGIAREQWLTQQRMKAMTFAGVALLFFVVTNFGAVTADIPEPPAEEQRKLSVEQVLDAGSVEAAEEQFGNQAASRYCLGFNSNSCFYTYEAYNSEQSAVATDKLFNLLLLDIGITFLLFAVVGFAARRIFLAIDIPYTIPKKNFPPS